MVGTVWFHIDHTVYMNDKQIKKLNEGVMHQSEVSFYFRSC